MNLSKIANDLWHRVQELYFFISAVFWLIFRNEDEDDEDVWPTFEEINEDEGEHLAEKCQGGG